MALGLQFVGYQTPTKRNHGLIGLTFKDVYSIEDVAKRLTEFHQIYKKSNITGLDDIQLRGNLVLKNIQEANLVPDQGMIANYSLEFEKFQLGKLTFQKTPLDNPFYLQVKHREGKSNLFVLVQQQMKNKEFQNFSTILYHRKESF